MKSIYKYKVGYAFHGDNVTPIEVPKSAQVLSVKQQDYDICAWYLVDTNDEETRTDIWKQVGTGHNYEDDFLCKDEFKEIIVANPYVWHMFVKENYQNV